MSARHENKKRLARIVTAGGVLLAAVAVQYYLANRPLPVEAEKVGELSPATARLGRHELTIVQPDLGPQGLWLTYNGTGTEVLDATFDSARAADDLLRRMGFDPPDGARSVAYLAHDSGQLEAATEPCRTFLEILAEPGARSDASISLSQDGSPGLDRFRALQIRSDGARLVVRLMTASVDGNPFSPLCSRLLRIDAFEVLLQGSQAVRLTVEPGATVRLRVGRAADGSAPWGGPTGFLEGFILGESPPLRAAGIVVAGHTETEHGSRPVHAARRPEGEPALSLDRLRVGSDQVQVSVAGTAWATVDGDRLTDNLFDRLKRYPFFSGLFGTANAALVAWLVGALRRKKE